MIGYRIEEITDADLDGIIIVERECFFSEAWSRESLNDTFESRFSGGFAAKQGDEIIGFALFSVIFEDGELLDIAVSPDKRELGIASALMGAVHKKAEEMGAQRILLEVRASNEPAIRLYEKFGYVTTGFRRNYYKNPTENAVLMEKLVI